MSYNDPFGEGLEKSLSPNGKKSPVIGLKRKNGILTNVELQALKLMQDLSPTKQYAIFPQVHVLQIFDIDSAALENLFNSNYVLSAYHDGISGQVKRAWNYEMGWKSIDFLLCDNNTTRVLFGIEIDDPSHDEPERQASDLVKNILFASASIPLLRFTNANITQFSNLKKEQYQSTFQSLFNSAEQSWKSTIQTL